MREQGDESWATETLKILIVGVSCTHTIVGQINGGSKIQQKNIMIPQPCRLRKPDFVENPDSREASRHGIGIIAYGCPFHYGFQVRGAF